jgi:hypothetical protein
MHSLHRTVFLISLLFLVTCSTSIPANTGIEGQVFIGPVCPVVQINNPCPDKTYQASLSILTTGGRKVTKFTTDAEGRFHVPLAPGNYILHPETPPNQPMPHAPELSFSVVAGMFTQLKVVYDSGIR